MNTLVIINVLYGNVPSLSLDIPAFIRSGVC